jgi:hypothetical protein
MAQPCADAEGVRDACSITKAKIRTIANRIVRQLFIGTSTKQNKSRNDATNLMRPQIHEPDAVREEHDQHHANAEYHGWDQE